MTVIIWTDNHGADVLDTIGAAYYYSVTEPAILHHDGFRPAQVTHRYEMPITEFGKHQTKLNAIWTRLQFVKSTSGEEAHSATHSSESARFLARPSTTTACISGAASIAIPNSQAESKRSSPKSTTSGVQDADQKATTVQKTSVTAASSKRQSNGSTNEQTNTTNSRCILSSTIQRNAAYNAAFWSNGNIPTAQRHEISHVPTGRKRSQIHDLLSRRLHSRTMKDFLEGALLVLGLIGLIATGIASFHHHHSTLALFAATSTMLLQLQILVIKRQ